MESVKKTNLKRENKAYSYKEQIIEMELQEVKCLQRQCICLIESGSHCHLSLFLQELKKKKGIKEELQLTSKQKEMMQIQLEKEAAIRKRLQAV